MGLWMGSCESIIIFSTGTHNEEKKIWRLLSGFFLFDVGTRELNRILGNHNEGLSIDFLKRVDSGQFGNLFGHCLKELWRTVRMRGNENYLEELWTNIFF